MARIKSRPKARDKAKAKAKAPNPWRADPTRMASLQRAYRAVVRWRFKSLASAVWSLVVTEDAFGLGEGGDPLARALRSSPRPTANARWTFQSTADQVAAFEEWLASQMQGTVLQGDALWAKLAEDGFRKGLARGWDDVRKVQKSLVEGRTVTFGPSPKDAFAGRQIFRPESVEKVKLLAGRTFADLKGVTDQMAVVMRRTLVDGLVRGLGPKELGTLLNQTVNGLGLNRALAIARTELVRAHASGQLAAYRELGVKQVGVQVEWETSDDSLVCELCNDMDGSLMSLDEAEGEIPLHTNCRCAWKPAAKVMEDLATGQEFTVEVDDVAEDQSDEPEPTDNAAQAPPLPTPAPWWPPRPDDDPAWRPFAPAVLLAPPVGAGPAFGVNDLTPPPALPAEPPWRVREEELLLDRLFRTLPKEILT